MTTLVHPNQIKIIESPTGRVSSLVTILKGIERRLTRRAPAPIDADSDPLADSAVCAMPAANRRRTYDDQRLAFEAAADAAMRDRYARVRRLSMLAGGALSYLSLPADISPALYAEARDHWADDGEITLVEYCKACSLMYKVYIDPDTGDPSARNQCRVCCESEKGPLNDFGSLHAALPRIEPALCEDVYAL